MPTIPMTDHPQPCPVCGERPRKTLGEDAMESGAITIDYAEIARRGLNAARAQIEVELRAIFASDPLRRLRSYSPSKSLLWSFTEGPAAQAILPWLTHYAEALVDPRILPRDADVPIVRPDPNAHNALRPVVAALEVYRTADGRIVLRNSQSGIVIGQMAGSEEVWNLLAALLKAAVHP